MALPILRLCVVFTIGIQTGPAYYQARALDNIEKDSALSLHLQDPQDVTVPRGQSATLRCDADSSLPGLKTTWLRNGYSILQNDSRYEQRPDGSLVVTKVVPGKKGNGVIGEYACLVRNNAGALLSSSAKLRAAMMDKDLKKSPGNLTLYESQPALLQCNIHSVPTATIRWERNQLPLPHNPRYVPLPNGALLITETQFTDSGLYRCIAENPILHKTKYSRNTTLTVLPPNADDRIPPTFLQSKTSTDQTVLVGDTARLFCIVTGWPVPQVQWLKSNGIVIANSTVLEIPKASLKDTDNYTCMAYNSEGRIVQNYAFKVYQKPQFTVTPTSKRILLARILRLKCQATGVPAPNIHWLKDGKELTIGNVSRVKNTPMGIVVSYTYLYDSGIYQCVAVNSAGRTWTAAQVDIIALRPVPPPPQSVQCRPFNETSICLTWKSPPNVTAQAYTLYPFYTNNGYEVALREYLTNNTYQLVNDLSKSTNYTFHVRLYNAVASNESDKVTCTVGDGNERELDLEAVGSTSVALKWSELSSDMPCNSTKAFYRVQWRRDENSPISSARTSDRNYTVSDLIPGSDYQFRVLSNTYYKDKNGWVLFSLPRFENSTFNQDMNESTVPPAPKHLEGVPVSPDSVNLTWETTPYTKFYTVCYVAVNDKKRCEEGEKLKSFPTKLLVKKLMTNTDYEFRVRAYNFKGEPGSYSEPLEVRTLADVPSPVEDLKYTIINSTTACLYWSPPKNKNGKLLNYTITYTPDRNWSLEEWPYFTVPANVKQSQPCHLDKENGDIVSTYLTGLSVDKQYIVTVRAGNEIGLSRPGMLPNVTTDVTLRVTDDDGEFLDNRSEVLYNQKIGIIIGIIVALTCIFFCVLFILLRRQCLKRRALIRGRQTASSNYYPAIAHYASNVGTVQIRLEDPCSADMHEVQRLVAEDRPAHIPLRRPSHLDTKGVDDFPNGHLNGSSKPYMNGNTSNGHVHITENPQYFCAFQRCNKKKSKTNDKFEEDSNSNVKSSKFYDVYRLFEKKVNNNQHCKSNKDRNNSFDSVDYSPHDITRLTTFSNCIEAQRRMSPILGPNG